MKTKTEVNLCYDEHGDCLNAPAVFQIKVKAVVPMQWMHSELSATCVLVGKY